MNITLSRSFWNQILSVLSSSTVRLVQSQGDDHPNMVSGQLQCIAAHVLQHSADRTSEPCVGPNVYLTLATTTVETKCAHIYLHRARALLPFPAYRRVIVPIKSRPVTRHQVQRALLRARLVREGTRMENPSSSGTAVGQPPNFR